MKKQVIELLLHRYSLFRSVTDRNNNNERSETTCILTVWWSQLWPADVANLTVSKAFKQWTISTQLLHSDSVLQKAVSHFTEIIFGTCHFNSCVWSKCLLNYNFWWIVIFYIFVTYIHISFLYFNRSYFWVDPYNKRNNVVAVLQVKLKFSFDSAVSLNTK